MKTYRVLGLLVVPTVLGILLASCGGSGGGSQGIPSGRPNFKLGNITILNPTNGESNVCLQPDIQIEVPYNSGLCRNGSNLEDWIQVRKIDGEQTVDLLPTMSFRQGSSNSSTCMVETRPSRALIPESDYYISVDKEGGGSFIFRPGAAAEFTTTTQSGNSNCRNAFKIADTNSWQETGILEFGQYDSANEEIVFDEDELVNFFFDNLASSLLGFIFPASPVTQEILFNSPVNERTLSSNIRIYRFEPGSNPSSFSLFEPVNLPNGACAGELGNPTGQCIFIDPLDDHLVVVQIPQNYLADGMYVLFVLDGLKAKNGKFLNSTYYKNLND
jgi:hypothetical protein